jgi:peptide/nickel transport system substrate-binding protein
MSTRREILKAATAASALIAAPSLVFAQAAPTRARTLRAVMHGDLAAFDPIWTTANMASYHGGLIYDTLFGIDSQYRAQPQMVQSFNLSDDKKTYTFVLRDGLRFSSGEAVTAKDCVASIRRWAARDGGGQHMFRRVTDTPVVDEKTFRIVLREPYPLLIDWLAKASTNVCYMMREKEALTDPQTQISEYIGSGPFIYNRTESRQGARYVYDRNPNYVPRSEPASFMAGGKVARMDRVIMENMADPQTQVAALQAGEIDFVEWPSLDLIDTLEKDRNIKLEVMNQSGTMGWCRLNHLHAPFNNVLARRAMLYLTHPTEVMKATFGNEKYYRGCGSIFACNTPTENDANTDWFKGGQNIDRARQLFREAGYDGRPVVLLSASNVQHMTNAGLLYQQWLRAAGVNVELVTSDWGGVVARRANRNPPDQGGWNIFFTSASGNAYSNPVSLAGHASNGTNAWFGWPTDEKNEQLRDAWAAAATPEERMAAARAMQENAWNYVPHVHYGQWLQPSAMRANLTGMIGMPELAPFWNVGRTG